MSYFSIIVPVYNIEIYKIDRCFNSILNQLDSKDELIFVDDGSNDETANFLDTLKLENVIVIHQINGGAASARNTGLEIAKNEWIVFVDPDDWIKENSLQEVKTYLNTNKDIYIFDYYGTSDEKEIKKYCFFTFKDVSKEDIYRNLLGDRYYTNGVDGIIGCGVPWAHVYKKSFLDNNNLRFDPKFKREEDNFFTMYATSKTDKIEIVNYPFYIYWSGHCFTYLKTFKRNMLEYIPEEAKDKTKFHYSKDMSKELYSALINHNYLMLEILLKGYLLNSKVKDSKKEKKEYLKFMKSFEPFKLVYKGKRYLSFRSRIILYLYRTNQMFVLKMLKNLKSIIKKILKKQ